MADPLAKLCILSSPNGITHEECDIHLADFSYTLLVLHAMFKMYKLIVADPLLLYVGNVYILYRFCYHAYFLSLFNASSGIICDNMSSPNQYMEYQLLFIIIHLLNLSYYTSWSVTCLVGNFYIVPRDSTAISIQ